MKLIRTFVTLLLAAALLAGCTASFTYNRLDWLIPWYVDGYVDLTRDQRKLLREQLEPRLQWHREEELGRYVEILDGIESDISGPVSAEQVQGWVDEILTAARRVEESMMSLALEFGADINDEQMEEFIASLREQQDEYEEEYLSRSNDEYMQDNFDNLVEFMERFLGRLTPAQEALLKEAAASMRRFDSAWLEEREAWLDTLEPLLQRESGWQAAIEQAYSDRENKRTPEYRDIADHNAAVVTQAVAEVLNSMSGKQRKRVVQEIEDLRRKLRKLIERGARK